MSQSDNAQKYEYLNAISTEQLRELLELEISSDRDNDELVLHILGVIKERNKQNGEASNVTWQQARADFDEYYNTPDGKGRSLYPTDIGPKKVPTKKSPGKVVRWIATVAAVLVLVVFVVPPALGDADVWDMVVRWSDNVLQAKHAISSEEAYEPIAVEVELEDSSLNEIFKTYRITTPLIPQKYPEGYFREGTIVQNHPSTHEIIFLETWRNESREALVVTITKHTTTKTRTYEKDMDFLDTYTVFGINHTIFSNNNVLSAMWIHNEYECSITANIALNEMIDMIDSIYEWRD